MNTRRFISLSSKYLRPASRNCLPALEFRCAKRETHDLRKTLQVHRAAEAWNLRPWTAWESFAIGLCLLLGAAATAASAPTKSHHRAVGHRVGVARGQHRVLATHEHLTRLGRHLSAEHRLHDRVDLLRASLRAQRREVGPVRERCAGNLTGGEGEAEIDSVENRARVHPRVAAVRPSIGSLPAENRLSKSGDE